MMSPKQIGAVLAGLVVQNLVTNLLINTFSGGVAWHLLTILWLAIGGAAGLYVYERLN